MAKMTLKNFFIGLIILTYACIPLIFFSSVMGGYALNLVGVILLVFLVLFSVFGYLKLSKGYMGVKPKIGKFGFFLIAINFGCIALVFSCLFILALTLTGLFQASWFYGWLPKLFLIDVAVLYCSSIAWLLYFRIKGSEQKQLSVAEKILCYAIGGLDVFVALFIFASIPYWDVMTLYVEFFILAVLTLMFLASASEYHFTKERAFPSIDKTEFVLISVFLAIITAVFVVAFTPLLASDYFVAGILAEMIVYGDIALGIVTMVHRYARLGKRPKIGN
jgi:hypothetical protein